MDMSLHLKYCLSYKRTIRVGNSFFNIVGPFETMQAAEAWHAKFEAECPEELPACSIDTIIVPGV